MSDIRIPTQKRSIETRNKIIESGFELICEKGYYNTNTAEIAEHADVSTGIIYQYFNDKKEILIEGVKNYSKKIMFPLINIDENIVIDSNYDDFLSSLIDAYIKEHYLSKKAHEELMALSHTIDEVSDIFKNTEYEVTIKFVKILENNNINITNPYEKVHLSIALVDTLCHEIIYHKHENINYEIMKDEVLKTIKFLLKKAN